MADLPPLLTPLFEEHHTCERCGLAYPSLDVDTCLGLVAESTATLSALLPSVDESVLRQRPSPDVWSVVEYACHVRDVLLTYAVRIHRGVVEERPTVDPMYGDWRAERFGYAAMPMDVLVVELGAAATGFAAEVATVPDQAWDRQVVRRPDEVRTVRWLVRQAAHECVHHLADVTALASGAARRSPAGS
jgi:hypothetical protein